MIGSDVRQQVRHRPEDLMAVLPMTDMGRYRLSRDHLGEGGRWPRRLPVELWDRLGLRLGQGKRDVVVMGLSRMATGQQVCLETRSTRKIAVRLCTTFQLKKISRRP